MKEPQTIKAKKVDKYVVLSNGEVWNMSWHGKPNNIKKIKQSKDKNGYLRFTYNGGGNVWTHRLVAKCFISNPNNLPQVNHKDENPLNNHVDNLEWCTCKYNVNYGTAIQRAAAKNSTIQKNDPKKSKKVYQLTLDGKFVAEYQSTKEVERQLGFCQPNVSSCCRNGGTYKGFRWTYIRPANI